MLHVFFTGYVHFFSILLPAMALAIITIGATRAGLAPARTGRALILPALLVSLWFAFAMYLSERDFFNVPATLGNPPYVLISLFGGAFILWALACMTPTGRQIMDHTSPGLIAAYQIPRVMGAVFLAGWAAGVIPWQFALPAGLGDIAAGIAGYRAWKACKQGDPDAHRKIAQSNVIGILDFAVAVVTGILTSEGFAHLLSPDLPNIINLHPLAMFPGFFVPMFLGFHLISITQLRWANSRLPVTG